MRLTTTCVTEAELAALDVDEFAVAHLVDESGRQPQFLFNVYPSLRWPAGQAHRRLVVQVADAHDLATVHRVLAALGVEPLQVPF